MTRLLRASLFMFLPILLIAACSPAASTPTVAPTVAPTAVETPVDDTASGQTEMTETGAESASTSETTESEAVEMAEAPASVAADLPVWQTMPLVNARTGETFTLADFSGKTVYVEPMATWCINCRQQLTNLSAAQGQLDLENVVLVALSVETNITAETLASYATNNNFDFIFAVLTPEMLAELVNQFGRVVTSSPSTPHFIIRADGTTTELATGIKSSEALVTMLQAESQ